MAEKTYKIFLDAGHGGTYDPGAVYQERREKDDNLNLALAVGEILTNYGFDVVYDRTEDVYHSPIQKARAANASGADLFVSIHRNSSPAPNQYSGVESLVYRKPSAAATIGASINWQMERIGYRNLGVKERPNLIVLRRTQMPAVLVEVGFLNTDYDNAFLDQNFAATAKAIADGIAYAIWDGALD